MWGRAERRGAGFGGYKRLRAVDLMELMGANSMFNESRAAPLAVDEPLGCRRRKNGSTFVSTNWSVDMKG